MQVSPSLFMIILPASSHSLHRSSSCFPVQGALADGLDGALEAGGCLQLELVGHGVNLEPVQPGEERVTNLCECFFWTLLALINKHDETSEVATRHAE